jgi:hypothetical protein
MLFEVGVSEWLAGAARSWLSPLGSCAPEPAAVVCAAAPSPAAAPNPAAAPAAAAAPRPGVKPNPGSAPGVAGAGPDPVSRAAAGMIDMGSQSVVGWRAPTSASRPSAVGRCRGSLARQRSISGRTSAGT